MSVPTENNISAKEYSKITKYKDLEIDIEKLGHMKTTTVPVIVEALSYDQERYR